MPARTITKQGLKVERKFTRPNSDPLNEVEYEIRSSKITEPNGKIVFEMDNIEAPKSWSQLSVDIAASKYFKRSQVPEVGRERSVKNMVSRVSMTIKQFGEENDYFYTEEDAQTFEDELNYMLINQMGAFNSPVWFNVGLFHKYGITGNKPGAYFYNLKTNQVEECDDSYSHPQASACFIQKIEDSLDSIYQLITNESKIFKFGSGTGSSFSALRGAGERLSGGGVSSGLMSYLRILDRSAAAVKSGGITRRAAKMVVLDMDHPEIEEYITWKVKEEDKVQALIKAGYSSDFNGEAYQTVSGQNSNNSVMIPDIFMQAVIEDKEWHTVERTTGKIRKTYKARDLMRMISHAAWRCADPGVMFYDTMNKWNVCADTEHIHATNPCVTGDTKVLTKDGKWIRIDKLLNKKTKIITNTGIIQENEIDGSFKTGVKPVYKLTTKSGYELKLTANHKIFTINRGFVQAMNLTKDDLVLLPFGPVAQIEATEDKEFYQILGVYLGDGCGSKTRRAIALTMNEDDKFILEDLSVYIAENFERITHKNHPAVVQIVPTSIKLNITNKGLVEKINEYVDITLKSHGKKLGEKIFELPLSSQKYVLQGLFTADGTVANYGEKSQYISLDSSSLQLLKDAQIILSGFGIKSKIYSNRRAGKETALLPDGKGGIKEYRVKPQHSLRISRTSRILFEKHIGFIPGTKKAEKLSKLNQQVTVYKEYPFDFINSLIYMGEEEVYDLTENVTHTFVANGITVHNCAEFVFLDDTACNLASLNLMKFINDNGDFDTEAYRHACKIFIIAQEILVDLASYPTKIITQRSHDLRPLGLGYANLGTLLMINGIAYDSDKARTIAAAITAITTGHAYTISAEIASFKGGFADFEKNRESMLRVMNMHRDAAYKIDVRYCPSYLLEAAREDWDNVITLGEKYGFRNAQSTVLAPTGCLTANSLISTEMGLIRLSNLGNIRGNQWQDVKFKVMTDNGPKEATKFYINGFAETRIIKTSSGYEIQGTENHKIKVLDSETREFVWKKFSDVKEGDIVPLAMNTLFGKTQEVLLPTIPELHWNCDFELKTPKNMSESLAELIGYFMGDGSLHSKGLRFCVSNEDIDVVEHLGKIIKNLFNKDIKVSQCKGYKEVAINSVPLAMWWDACGFSKIKPTGEHYGKGYKPYIPDAILHTNDKDIYSAFLRGLFEADGTITAGNPSFSTVNKEFSEEIKTLLLCLGYPTTTKIDISGWGKSALYVLRLKNISYNGYFMKNISLIGKRKRNKVNLNRSLQTGNRDYIYLSEEIVDEVVPVGNSHRGVVLVSLKRHRAIPRERIISIYKDSQNPKVLRALQFFYDSIESNNEGGIHSTYDLSVPENVTYVANGFVSHNTIGLLMGCDTTGIEPEFSLIKWKKLAGGGYFKIINSSIEQALEKLRYDDIERKEIISYVMENGNIENAPHIRKEHLSIFDCANKNSGGLRFIEPMGHVKIIAAVQPFVSGSISKTVNLPSEATIEDIEQIYFQAWKLGLKDIALYRDGCKLSQPLNTQLENKQETVTEKAIQKKLPYKRKGITIASKINGNKIFLRTGEYEDGKIGEIFVDMHKAGSSYRSLMSCFAIAVSMGLQHGVPLEKFVDLFTFTRFEPSGLTDHPNIRSATSVIDFIFRVLGMEYLGRTDFVHIPPATEQELLQPKNENEIHEAKKAEIQTKLPNDAFSSKEKHLGNMLGDAPLCDQCGHTTVRSAASYKCLNCGNSMGCS